MNDAVTTPAPPCVYNIPLALDHTLLQTQGPQPHFAKNRNTNLFADCHRSILGPMPVQEFVDHFLPPLAADDKSDMLETLDAFKSVPLSAVEAPDIYKPLVTALNECCGRKSRCPGFVFEVAATRSSHPKRPGYMKPHICCYTPENAAVVERSDPESRVEFGYVELFIDIQPDKALDFFVDPPSDSEPASRVPHDFLKYPYDEVGRRVIDLITTLGQHLAYAAEVLARQPRTFVFTVALSGSRARLLRWDRAGGVATETFDLREQPDLLCEFLWRFSQTTCAGRGHDPSVQPATEDEEKLFREIIERHARSQLDKDDEQALKNAVAKHYKPGHVYAIDILHQRPQNGERTRRYIVSRPLVSSLGLVGRAMREVLEKDSRIHRDISVGNIILVKEEGAAVRRGYLVDWETSCKVDDAGAATQVGRLGTWQYLSIRMLSADEGHKGKATFQDDMESLLYVVLHSALLWQKHDAHEIDLTNIITEMFNKSRELAGGFENRDLSEWLNTVMDFHSPPPHLQAAYKDKWSDPEQLDAYWHDFLKTRTLARDNRTDNKLDEYDLYDSITPTPSPSPPYIPVRRRRKTPPPTAPRWVKVKVEQSDDESSESESQPRKQARTEKPPSTQLDGIQPTPAQPDAVQPAAVAVAGPARLCAMSFCTPRPVATALSQDPLAPPPVPLRRSPRKHASSQPKRSSTGSKPRKTRTAGTSSKTPRK
ncbi:hypothetical protein GSI_07191 [Ganoderma sinense ZZ0214-1]|uniref:Fungal-type protein kinase domain-containing protein n=1 Tax=Ganoderma sinense ZZ0214-1 TaxID=1077348 RepID=A0A2G8S9R8_9APHY|nr:hypothetical protein GSI_07191 [Ganoderma sinense ZZ0214-1]